MGRGSAVLVTCALASAAHARPAARDRREPAKAAPRQLLDAPSFGPREPHAFAAFAGEGAYVRVAWSQVPGAVRYHATWTDSKGHATDSEVPTSAFEKLGVAPGHYTLLIGAVDATGMAGALTAPFQIDVLEVRATPPGTSAPAGPTRGAYAIGTKFFAPGLHCELGSAPSDKPGAPSNELRATTAGAEHLRCRNATGTQQTDTPVVIAPVIVSSRNKHVARDRTTLVHLDVASVAGLGEDLEVRTEGDIEELGEPRRTEDGFDVPVTVRRGARRATLVVAAAGLELGKAELNLIDAPPIEELPPGGALAWWAADVGGQIGAFLPATSGSSAPSLGHPADRSDTASSGPFFGPRIGIFPIPRAGLELEASLVTAGYQDKGGVNTLLAARAQLAVRAFDQGRIGVRALAGAGTIATLHDFATSHAGASGEIHYGAALTIETRPNLWVRVQALDVITTAQDAGYAHSVELELAVVTRLGRRDRW